MPAPAATCICRERPHTGQQSRPAAGIHLECRDSEAMTGLTDEQLTDLVVRVHVVCAGNFVSRGRPIALGLFRSVAMVVFLMRKNVTQDVAGAVFDVSQPTVSRPVGPAAPGHRRCPRCCRSRCHEIVGRGTVLVDGTVCPTWDWGHVPDLYSAKVGFPGINLQIAATLDWSLSDRSRFMVPAMTPTPPSRHLAWRRLSPAIRRLPIWAMSGSTGST